MKWTNLKKTKYNKTGSRRSWTNGTALIKLV